MTKYHLERYLRSLSYHDQDVDEASIEWDILEPWKATYWKELQVGHRVRFICKEKSPNSHPVVPYLNQVWYDKLWYSWNR